MEDKISIVIPVYNVEKYLKKCVNSVLNQSFKNIEILLIDDGSTDNSSNICDEFSKIDSRIKVFHIENSGVSFARNFGIEKSEGKYITFVDSDDFISENMIEILYKNLLNYNADVSIGNLYHTFNHESIVDEYEEKIFLWNNEITLKKFLQAKETSFFPVAKLFKKEIFNEIRFNSKYKLAEDALFLTELFLSKELLTVYSTKKVYGYFHHDNSATTKIDKDTVFDTIKVHSLIFDSVMIKYPNLKVDLLGRKYWSYFVVYDKIILSEDIFFEKKIKDLTKILRRNFFNIVFDKSFNISRKIALFFLLFSKKIYKFIVKLKNKKL